MYPVWTKTDEDDDGDGVKWIVLHLFRRARKLTRHLCTRTLTNPISNCGWTNDSEMDNIAFRELPKNVMKLRPHYVSTLLSCLWRLVRMLVGGKQSKRIIYLLFVVFHRSGLIIIFLPVSFPFLMVHDRLSSLDWVQSDSRQLPSGLCRVEADVISKEWHEI